MFISSYSCFCILLVCMYILYMYIYFVYVCMYYSGSTQYRLAFCVTPSMYMAKIDNNYYQDKIQAKCTTKYNALMHY